MAQKITLSVPASPLSGTVTITANCTQPQTVEKVEFYIDSVLKTPADTSPPFTYSWNTTGVADGTHNIFARATYPSRQVQTDQVTRTVSNQPAPPPPPPVQAVPVNVTVPVIIGTATEGQVLSIVEKTTDWTNSPTSYTHWWDRCDAAGANCVDISNGGTRQWTLGAADVGKTMRCWTTAFNAAGPSVPIISAQTAVVTGTSPGVPVLVSSNAPYAPAIAGTLIRGNSLTISNGSWTNSPTSYTHCWMRCDANGNNPVEIAGQNCDSYNNTYVVQAADVGLRLKAYTTAKNATGDSTPHLTAATAVIQDATTPPPPPPVGQQLTRLTDFVNNSWTQTLVNRWGLNDPEWTLPSYTGTAWPSGQGVQEVTTAQGPGFRFRVPAEARQGRIPDNGKCVFIADIGHFVPTPAGQAQVWSGKFMMPASGNVDGLAPLFGVLFEFHTESMSGNNINIVPSHQPNPGCLRWTMVDVNTPNPGGGMGWYTDYVATQLGPIQFDRWYSWRLEIKWSYGGDGYARGYIDNNLIGNHIGPSVKSGEHPYLQFGYYADTYYVNEIYHVDVRIA